MNEKYYIKNEKKNIRAVKKIKIKNFKGTLRFLCLCLSITFLFTALQNDSVV